MEKNEEQLAMEQLEILQKEIAAELNHPEAYGYDEPYSGYNPQTSAARKPYRINDFDPPRDKEMAVFTHAKKLSEYIFVITEKSPKKFRWSIIARLQNCSVEVVENLYHANFEYDLTQRLVYQKSAAVSLKLLDFYAETARTKQAITIHQTAVIAEQLAETGKLLNGWIRSTKRPSSHR